MEATIRLFRALPITKTSKKYDKTLMANTIKKGFVFSPAVIANYSYGELCRLADVVEDAVGLSADKMNNAFHKSWKKIKTADIEQLVLEQLVHYITTYGYERLGIYDKDTVYIPQEELKIPKTDVKGIPLVVIRGYTKKVLKDKIIDLLQSGVALKEDTKRDVIDVATFVGFDETEVSNIKNKEVRVALYDYLGMFPENPIEFLRFAIYKSINKTLLIKNGFTIHEIKTKDNLAVLGLLNKYDAKFGLERLAEVFYRFKPLFLAFRTNKKLKVIINRIGKLAQTHHKPMKEDYLNTVTSMISNGKTIKKDVLVDALNQSNIFRKIRLAYALKFRTSDAESILYRIRNGKSYATSFQFDNHKEAKGALEVVLRSIVKDIEPKVKGKKIFIPSGVQYALPATEKQFTGNLPSGTSISVSKDMVFGVHWEDVGNTRIDLDLSLLGSDGCKTGWDANYRSGDRKILFSGDMTAAPKPNGASELFYVARQTEASLILFVNYFNHDEDVEVPFKILVAEEPVKNLSKNYMVNPNNVVGVVATKIKERQRMLGLVTVSPNECKFYFAEADIGNSITSYGNKYSDDARRYLFDFYKNAITLNEVLDMAGAKLVSKKDKCDVDLSLEGLEKDTILSLIRKS